MAKLVTISAGLLLLASLLHFSLAEYVDPSILDGCPGYDATNIRIVEDGTKLIADLLLAGEPCNVFGGGDLKRLTLNVVYETDTRIHVKITDPLTVRYEIPEDVVPIASADDALPFDENQAEIKFSYTESPFTFTISRASSDEVLVTTAGHPLIFTDRYLRLKATLPQPDANIYGLGEHTNTFRLPTANFTRTLWSRDAGDVPPGTNLYGNHPVWITHSRETGTHGAFLRNSNGMDIKIDTQHEEGTTTIEYNLLGGVFDFYFLAGSTTEPAAVARQYADVVGLPAEVPYWSFGLHQCRYGYQNYVDVAGVINNYSAAGIPLETMWTDIDYMKERRVFTLDPEYFPLERMREIVDYLHDHDQQCIVMVDPAVYYAPEGGYAPYDRGVELGIWLKEANGSDHLGVVWPGVTVWPDWFHPKIDEYWKNEFRLFFSPETGLDIDGAWIDMNEPTNFCQYPCDDPQQQAKDMNFPPKRPTAPPDPDAPIFESTNTPDQITMRSSGERRQESHEYHIDNAEGLLSQRTAHVDTVHANGLVEYDTHNLYGTMMSSVTQRAMAARRPGKRTLIITRSSFAGAGRHVGKWLGDNISNWEQYRFSIAGNLQFASIFQIPMVGSDICGFRRNTTETLCARWATLGAFSPFMRNHNVERGISQEFYRWDSVTRAAKNGIDMRYRLLDYFYTAFHQAKLDGTPVLYPLFYLYPTDPSTFSIDLQFFFGPSILVSPVTQENVTSVEAYFPDDIFYDFLTLVPFNGQGTIVTLNDIPYDAIPVHIRGGAILPLRVESAMTTRALRTKNFELVVAPDRNGEASGELYFDDGESVEPEATTELRFTFVDDVLEVKGNVGLELGVELERIRIAGVEERPMGVDRNGEAVDEKDVEWDGERKVLTVRTGGEFRDGLKVELLR